MVSALKAESLKTQISKGTELQVPIWHSGTHNTFLIHMGSSLDAIKKRGHFKAHDKANEAYVEQCELGKQPKATLAKLGRTTSKSAGTSKKPSKRHKEAVAMADTSEPDLQAMYHLDLEKAREAAEKAKVKAELADQDMFQFYTDFMSVDAE
jgi:hypothetical protein